LAQRHGVSLTTVRSQIGSLRAKTGAGSIRNLVRQVSLLPPMRNSLRTPA
jgi:DNA-binding CsgD family transcriptional regulator